MEKYRQGVEPGIICLNMFSLRSDI